MTYALSNDWDLAERRLTLLERCHDAASRRIADARGLGPGWKCLDAGAGGGGFARWLASRVGPDGHVVAADIDTRLLERQGELEVLRIGLAREDLPQAAFDLVHTRLLLIHVPEREAVLRKLAAAVRPGGVIVLEEDEIHPILATATGADRDGWLEESRAALADASRWYQGPATVAAWGRRPA